MAHNLIANKNGKIEMAFVGQTPWHGLGQQVAQGASLEVWKEEAGFNWYAMEATPLFEDATNAGAYREFSEKKILYRSDDGEPLGIVSNEYQIVQPHEVLEFFRDITESNGWYIHTAGVILRGRKLWVMASRDESQAVTGKDIVKNNILLATSLDGSMRTTVKDTAVRVVCNNTFTMALHGKGREIQVSHRSTFDADAIKRQLGLTTDTFTAFMNRAREMANIPISMSRAKELLNTVFMDAKRKPKLDLSWMNVANPKPLVIDDEVVDARSTARCIELFEGEGMGADLKGSKGTQWGLFNAVTQHVDYEMGRNDNNRLNSAWFGRGDGFKNQTFKLLAEEIG